MKIQSEKKGNVKILHVSEKLDAKSSFTLEENLNGTIKAGEKYLAMDFEKLDYISSAGLRVLLSIAKNLNQKEGKVKLVNLQNPVKEVFDLTGFTQIFEIFVNLEECVKSFQ